MKHKFIIAAALAVLMSVSAFATTAYAATSNNQAAVTESSSDTAKNSKQGKKEKVDEPENAIGKDKAKAAALKDAGIAADKVEKIRSRVTKLDDGTVVYHGLVPDMTEIYKVISCTVHPTYYPEGLSNVLLESAASGRAIITTDRSGCREVVEDGVNGFVVKQQDSQDLIEKIQEFLSLGVEERKAMGLAGRAKVEREFDRNIVIGKYLDEIRKAGR